MTEKFFGITYTFGRENVKLKIDNILNSNSKGYVCVADGVTLAMSHKNENLKTVLDNASITVCDSGWVPLYLKSIYKIQREQYCGSDLLMDIVSQKKYKIMFIGASPKTLDALKIRLSEIDNNVSDMHFGSLPFLDVEDFDYPKIAENIKDYNPDIVFVSLGMPKQEFFMYKLSPYIDRGILIGVGAAFKFHSGLKDQKRAPQWVINAKLEWLQRIISEPKKQIKRCSLIVTSLPGIYIKEYKKRKTNNL
ncbi:N-acetylglucosaminyldiphosphoundecaprenol N-acetyl-beta-D-mannosaminyltransferase [Dysgonomonadaceae bacterium PH5-43]|nr:N-acetylglucosaminyldiphosphoundecaprenol N-acetyl-beta-D-mannosaminyltransferase [Dysgonomonadaceae bacterium PH5-43]